VRPAVPTTSTIESIAPDLVERDLVERRAVQLCFGAREPIENVERPCTRALAERSSARCASECLRSVVRVAFVGACS
jgi:hypothetical protein